MTHTPKPLSESVLRRLTHHAIASFLSQARHYEAAAAPGLLLALSNEPVADLNMMIVGAGAQTEPFRQMVSRCLGRQLPFLVMIFPEAGKGFDELASELGLVYAVDWPIMVREDQPIEPAGHPDVEVVAASGEADAEASAQIMSSAFSMPFDSVLRTVSASFPGTPGADVFVARLAGKPVGSVTLTYHGDTCGIWAMGTDTDQQRGGVGRRLLSTAMAHARDNGVRRFFLGATPAGQRLYQSLGFETVCEAGAWVSGETHQA